MTVTLLGQMRAAIQIDAQVGTFYPLCGEQTRHIRFRQHRFILSRGAFCRFLLHSRGKSVCVRRDRADARLQIVVKKVSAELQIQAIQPYAGHGKEQNDGDHGDENISHDQPVAQRPHHSRSKPRNQADHQINDGQKAQEAQNARIRNMRSQRGEHANRNAQEKNCKRHAIKQRSLAERHDETAWRKWGQV